MGRLLLGLCFARFCVQSTTRLVQGALVYNNGESADTVGFNITTLAIADDFVLTEAIEMNLIRMWAIYNVSDFSQPERSRKRQPGGVVVGVMLLLIAIVTVYAARQRPRPAAVSSEETPRPATVDDKARREAMMWRPLGTKP